MDEGSFVLDPPTFGLNMDLEADMTSADDLLYYLTDGQGQIMDTTGAFDAAAHLLFDDLPPVSSFSSSPSSSSPASSPPSVSYSFSSSPVSSPSSAAYSSGEASPANSQSAGSSSDDGDHFVFGTWLAESALDTTISPAQLQMSSATMLEIQPLSTLPQLEILTPSASEDSDESSESKPQASKKDTRKRKRTKKNGDEAPPQTAVTLPRDELLKLSSQELEDYAENLRKVRKLTAEEEKDLRRQRRLIKNRESAQLSRVRRREHIEVIEQQLHEVQAENARLKLQVESLTSENLQLKQHIASSSASTTTTTLVPVSPPVNTNTNADVSTAAAAAAGEQVSASLINMVQGWTTLGKGATANAVKATYLFVILLSIGLFFNARFVHYGPGLGPLEMGPRPIMSQPFVYQPASAIEAVHTESIKQSAGGHVPLRPGRRLLQHDENFNVELLDDKLAAGSLKTKARMNSWQKETATETTQFPIDNSENAMPQAMTGEAANKTILMCPSLTPLHWPGQEMSAYADEITFILPASSATYIPSSRMITSSSSPSFSASARHASSGSMVQLTCKIVDARMASLDSLLVQ